MPMASGPGLRRSVLLARCCWPRWASPPKRQPCAAAAIRSQGCAVGCSAIGWVCDPCRAMWRFWCWRAMLIRRALLVPAPRVRRWISRGEADAARHARRALLEPGGGAPGGGPWPAARAQHPLLRPAPAHHPNGDDPRTNWSVVSAMQRLAATPWRSISMPMGPMGWARGDPGSAPTLSRSMKAWPRPLAASRSISAVASVGPAAASPCWRSASWRPHWSRPCASQPAVSSARRHHPAGGECPGAGVGVGEPTRLSSQPRGAGSGPDQ